MAGEKALKINTNGLVTEFYTTQTGGEANAGRIVSLDASGKLDETMLPTGVSPKIVKLVVPTGYTTAAGDFVNIYNDNGVAKIRKANASSGYAYRVHGFVKDVVVGNDNDTVDVYLFPAFNSYLSGLTIGTTYFLSKIPGGVTSDVSGFTSGDIVQEIGVAISATELECQEKPPIIKA